MVYYYGDLRFYLSALEEERSKIHVFRRELPLCYEVVTQTIDAWKKKLIEKDDEAGEYEHTASMDHPVILEELMNQRADEHDDDDDDDDDDVVGEETKSGWLRSARLWNPIPDLNAQQDNGEDPRTAPPEKPLTSATEAATSPERRQVQQGRDNRSSQRKQRRCWSAELHKRFLKALQELGGPQVATPKHIKDRMKVNGLTNDEIKSHLQKYRLHERRSPSIQYDDASVQGQEARPQLVIVGGIWMPPSEFTAESGSVIAAAN